MPSQPSDERWMNLALSLASRGLGQVWPNPAVGCVIVKNNRVLGRGWTQKGGRPHAETKALSQAGNAAQGATAYVTLEPCAHHGQTPPCTNALINAGITRVVSALEDPDERVCSKGHQQLRMAGIEVLIGVMSTKAKELNRGFFLKTTQDRPLVTLKLASSLDGRIATKTGQSRWISNANSRGFVHLLRAKYDAIMIGSGTALADDPDLRIRIASLSNRNPIRVILDTKLRVPRDGKLVKSSNETPLWICHGKETDTTTWQGEQAKLISCQLGQDGSLDLKDTLYQLAKKGITRILCEGGGSLAAALLQEKLVDYLIMFQAGVAIGSDGKPTLGKLNVKDLDDAPRFQLIDMRTINEDIMATWKIRYRQKYV